MKKKILGFTLGLVTLGAIVPTMILTQTSCNEDELAIAPDEFYSNGENDCTGFFNKSKEWHCPDKYNHKITYNEDQTVMQKQMYDIITDRSKYTPNMIKWDIINTYVKIANFELAPDVHSYKFKAKFKEFNVTNTTIQYKIEFQKEGEEQVEYYSCAKEALGSAYAPYEIKSTDFQIFDPSFATSTYKLPISQAQTGEEINTIHSVFIRSQNA